MDTYLQYPDKITGKKKRNFINAMMKYAGRRTHRTTPFGLFTAVGKGVFSQHNEWRYNRDSIYKKARVDLEWLFQLIYRLEDEHMEQLSIKLNPACYIKGDRAYLLYSTDGESEEIQIRATPAFQLIYKYCQAPVHFMQVIRLLLEHYPETTEQRIRQYMKVIFRQGFLISNLRPPLTDPDQFAYVIRQMELCRIEPQTCDQLKKIEQKIQEYNRMTPGTGEKSYLELFKLMESVHTSGTPLQIDAGIAESKLTLNDQIAEHMVDLASMLTSIAAPVEGRRGYMEDYRNKFIEKYGVNREIPLIEMLDTSSGIGAPFSYTHPANDYYEPAPADGSCSAALKNFLLLKYVGAVQNNHPIQLTKKELVKYIGEQPAAEQIPVSLELNFLLRLKNGQPLIYLGPNVGSRHAGKTFGRFSHLSDEINDILYRIYEQEIRIRNNTGQLCELSFVPNQLRSGNVTRNHSFRNKEMALFTNSSRCSTDQVAIEDVWIGVHQDRFYARHRQTGEILIFGANNMLNPLMSSNAIRFLQEMEESRRRSWSYFPWTDVYKGFKYIPEIQYEGIILSGQQWQIGLDDFFHSEELMWEPFLHKFEAFRVKYNLPISFYIANSDHRLMINTEDERSLRILFAELRKAGENTLQLVALEEGQPAITDQNGQTYAAEIVVPLVRVENEAEWLIDKRHYSADLEQQRLKMPFDDWLYIKLYGKQSREEELIALEFPDFCSQMAEKFQLSHFYMRYMDPKPHIRLRFHADSSALLIAMPHILYWLKGLRKQGLISEYIIASYDREVERYGGIAPMEAAERLFGADSAAVEAILRGKRMKQIELDMELIAMISVIRLLQQLGLNTEQQLKLMEYQNISNNEYRQEFKQQSEQYIRLCDCTDHWAGLREQPEGELLLQQLELRSKAAAEYMQTLKQQPQLTAEPDEIIGSVVHLHCNRLLGTNRELEHRIMTLAAHTLYALHSRSREGSRLWK
ncbi:lantibiotic dehydratase [Paenibacillus sp. Z6-24]